MKIYDASMTISKEMQVYKNKEEKKPEITVDSDFSNASTHESRLSFNLHTGTHMDFPLHIFNDGKTSDSVDYSKLIRVVKVFDLVEVNDKIESKDLLKFNITKEDFILFKTKNSYTEKFDFNFIYLSENAAQYLADKKIAGVGIDALGIERNQSGYPTHKILMNHDMIIIEGLRLKDVSEGQYMMYALPIKIEDVDALPLSVILIEELYEN